LARDSGKVSGALVFSADMSLENTEHVGNEFINVFAEHLAKIVVGYYLLWYVRAGADDSCVAHLVVLMFVGPVRRGGQLKIAQRFIAGSLGLRVKVRETDD
jgi:hypothetical protein